LIVIYKNYFIPYFLVNFISGLYICTVKLK
jgi:hypothetical protein